MGTKLVYAYISYALLMTAYTAINVPYSALMGVMTPSSEERTSLSTSRFVGAFTGTLLISMGVRPDDARLATALDRVIARRGPEIRAVLRAYGIPVVPREEVQG
jgi:hypothetical protein